MCTPNSDKELAADVYLIADGFKRMKSKIHLSSNGMNYKERLSAESILPSIRSIAYVVGSLDAYCVLKTILDQCNITRSARSLFERYVPDDLDKVTDETYSSIPVGRIWPLVEVIKYHNSAFYNTVYRFKFKSFQMFQIDLSEAFSLREFRSDVEEAKYKEDNQALGGLSRFIRYDDRNGGVFLVKEPDATIDGYRLSYVKPKTIKRVLDEITMQLTRNDVCREISAWSLLFSHLSQFTVRGSKFYSDSDMIVSCYHGFRYRPVANELVNVLMEYLDALCDRETKEALLDWMSFLVQKPSEPLKVVLRITTQTKELISKILLRLVTDYSVSNEEALIDSDHFTPLVENKRLIVLNSRYPNFERLSRVLSKRQPIDVSSDVYPSHPVIVDSALLIVSDQVSSSKSSICINCSRTIDISTLKDTVKNDSFYEGLMHALLNRDISTFNPTRIHSEHTPDVYDQTIKTNYERLISKEGIQLNDLKRSFSKIAPSSNWDTMKERLEMTCDMIRRSVNGAQRNRYYLKESCRDRYGP